MPKCVAPSRKPTLEDRRESVNSTTTLAGRSLTRDIYHWRKVHIRSSNSTPPPQPSHLLGVAALSCHDARLESFLDEACGTGDSRPRLAPVQSVPASSVLDVERFPSAVVLLEVVDAQVSHVSMRIRSVRRDTARQALDYGGTRSITSNLQPRNAAVKHRHLSCQ
ncbi:hypothetical protein LY76DRAFT_217218 [Colletotrichum caudatum]|nr:hypothetical protein LY76DRAFT_217218 [Colletotrichum caudatum]